MTTAVSADFSQALGTLDNTSVVTEVAERLLAVFTSGQIEVGARLPAERTVFVTEGVNDAGAVAVIDVATRAVK